ncbi:hypothetical protein C8R45DRAFT_782871, partial [Mycena sanguinolenta]
DDILSQALHDYARRSLPLNHHLDYFCTQLTIIAQFYDSEGLNRKFGVPTVKKPPPDHIASTLISEVMADNISSQNGPRTMQNQISLRDGAKIPQ